MCLCACVHDRGCVLCVGVRVCLSAWVGGWVFLRVVLLVYVYKYAFYKCNLATNSVDGNVGSKIIGLEECSHRV